MTEHGTTSADRKFAVNSWIYGPAPFAQIARRAAEAGFDGLDVSGDPDTLDPGEVRAVLADRGLEPTAVNGHYLAESRSLSHPDEQIRDGAVDYVLRCIDLAAEVGAPRVVVVPSQIGVTGYFSSRQADWSASVESLAKAADHAAQAGVTIALEPVNKYESGLVRSLDDGAAMIAEVGSPQIRLVADTFHMMLEESTGIATALRRHAGLIEYLHVGDNNRESPGFGCLPWREILLALKDIDFSGAVSFEPLPRRISPDEIFAGAFDPEILDRELARGLKYLRNEASFVASL